MSGWVKLHRSMASWEWYTDHNTCRLFIHCLIRANHSDTKWRGQEIKRGQFITSIETLQKETGLSISQIRTSIKKLISTNEIASLSQARSRTITVIEYDSYQGDDKLDDKLIASSSQAHRKLMTTDKNEKNVENEKNENKTLAGPALEIFKYWCETMNKNPAVAKLTPKREKAITARLKDYTAAQIKCAIDGCSRDPFSMGQNDRQKPFNDIELICRSGEKLESFLDARVSTGQYSAVTQHNIDVLSNLDLD